MEQKPFKEFPSDSKFEETNPHTASEASSLPSSGVTSNE
jgi:hypothetical protein